MFFNKMLIVIGLIMTFAIKPVDQFDKSENNEYLFEPITGDNRNNISDWEILHPSADAAARGILFDETVDKHLGKQDDNKQESPHPLLFCVDEACENWPKDHYFTPHNNPSSWGVYQSPMRYCADGGREDVAQMFAIIRSLESQQNSNQDDKGESTTASMDSMNDEHAF